MGCLRSDSGGTAPAGELLAEIEQLWLAAASGVADEYGDLMPGLYALAVKENLDPRGPVQVAVITAILEPSVSGGASRRVALVTHWRKEGAGWSLISCCAPTF